MIFLIEKGIFHIRQGILQRPSESQHPVFIFQHYNWTARTNSRSRITLEAICTQRKEKSPVFGSFRMSSTHI